MSVASGYVHISLRSAQNRAGANAARQGTDGGFQRPYSAQSYSPQQYGVQGFGQPGRPMAVSASNDSTPMTAPTAVVAASGTPGPQSVSNDTVARGFVIYVGLDEDTAAANGTSLTKLAQEMRALAHSPGSTDRQSGRPADRVHQFAGQIAGSRRFAGQQGRVCHSGASTGRQWRESRPG